METITLARNDYFRTLAEDADSWACEDSTGTYRERIAALYDACEHAITCPFAEFAEDPKVSICHWFH